MKIWFNGDGNGFEFHVEVNWQMATALLKAALATLLVLSALLAALGRFGS